MSAITTHPAPQPPPGKRPRLVYVCDWLPPDFGAVGQYSQIFARQLAISGADVVLVGLSSRRASIVDEEFEKGRLKTITLHAATYRRDVFSERLQWTVKTNTRLALAMWRSMRWTDEILFTGSPPLLLHWLVPLNLLTRKRLIYRITDFYPECIMATRPVSPLWVRLLYRLTLFWRRRVDSFEVLGEDQRMRLREIGIPDNRIRLKRDPSPVEISLETQPLTRPLMPSGKYLLLYSGNWGVAHDYLTFVEAYRRHHQQGSGRLVLWLNAAGSATRKVEEALSEHHLPMIRGSLVPLENLARLLVTPDAHLITLSNEFVGFVLPSKVYGCIASRRPIFFVGSDRSDVHRLCAEDCPSSYARVDVGDIDECSAALERLADAVAENTQRPAHRLLSPMA